MKQKAEERRANSLLRVVGAVLQKVISWLLVLSFPSLKNKKEQSGGLQMTTKLACPGYFCKEFVHACNSTIGMRVQKFARAKPKCVAFAPVNRRLLLVQTKETNQITLISSVHP